MSRALILTTGFMTRCCSIGPAIATCNWTCFMTTARTFHCTLNSRLSFANISRRLFDRLGQERQEIFPPDGVENFPQGLGPKAADHVEPWLAPCRSLGPPPSLVFTKPIVTPFRYLISLPLWLTWRARDQRVSELPIEEAANERRHFIELVFEREVSGIE